MTTLEEIMDELDAASALADVVDELDAASALDEVTEEPTMPNADRVKLILQAANVLKDECVAIAFHKNKMGKQKTLTPEQKAKSAEVHGTDPSSLIAAKRLLDPSSPHYSKVNGLIEAAHDYVISVSYQTTKKSVRLVFKDKVDEIETVLPVFKTQLDEAKVELESAYPSMIATAKNDLENLFNQEDYPGTISDRFNFSHEYVNYETPTWMLAKPELSQHFEKEALSFYKESVLKFEEQCIEVLTELLTHVSERLNGMYDDGKPYKFEDTTITKIVEFAENFKAINLNSNSELTALVESVESVFSGVDIDAIRKDPEVRLAKSTAAQDVLNTLDTLMVEVATRDFDLEI